jgi:ADP-heptose:LPS heptosyltransferase
LVTPPRKVLIFHAGGIGDLLLALPALRVFRQNFPGSALALMGRPERLLLVAFDLQADSVHSIDRAGMAYFYLEGETLPSGLSTFFSSFGIALAFGKSNVGILAKNLQKAGVDRVITIPSFPPEGLRIHVSRYLMESLRASGIEGEYPWSPLRLPEEAMTFAKRFLADFAPKEEDRLLAIHPGSGSPAKNWDPKNFATVAERLSEWAKILLISGPAQDGVEEVRQAMRKASPWVADNLSLLHLAAVLKASTAYLGNDSGITHLAASLGLPTVAIFGPTNPEVWGPNGPGVNIFSGKNLSSPRSSEARSECSHQGLEIIKPEAVIEVLSSFFA